MIDASPNILYTLRIGSKQVSKADFWRASMYTDYQGPVLERMVVTRDHTLQIDLTQTPEELIAAMKSNTRNEIRRAEREGYCVCRTEDTKQFVDYYNHFADEKQLGHISLSHLTRYGQHLQLYSSSKDGQILTMHASIVDNEQRKAYLLYSASTRMDENADRKAIGFANRYLHYAELLAFKEQGCTIYDFSGICLDRTNPVEYNIGIFKQAFGGSIVTRCHLMSRLMAILVRRNEHIETEVRINADDFGKTESINEAIRQCMAEQRITHTSLMANMPHTQTAIEIARANGFTEQVGLHFNLTEGPALSQAIRQCKRFVDNSGQFCYRRNSAIWLTRKERKAIREEFKAQLRVLNEAGIYPKHMDSHEHVHTEPAIMMAIAPLVSHHNIRIVRIARNADIESVTLKSLYKRAFNSYLRCRQILTMRYFTDYRFFEPERKNIEYECHPEIENSEIHMKHYDE